ncbi:YiaA/YiaB family inner membrane protein [Streptosporangium sp. NBC_01639]|uniref:YiaA/YiaB family inner membrane protein n=1 Tax=unclassified Streptosporangium TaxID=2632669 RepID=UPI002DD95E53|nr:YiaA/YiaB family inner membrane protein [Streptosporangium sp. NBC_01756]WSC83382.1 YiaA/YiaB family inner membrane protein [Streptosporangium sp. NBC_01756]WTD58040.1 YiaA/YiaB family inner membrane protein [Streptosporangium sp. NBC_01639]
MDKPLQPAMTAAYYAQSVISFVVALGSVALGIVFLPIDPWVRAFLAISVLYTVTSAFGLAKCVRDRQELVSVSSRVDQARLDKLLSEHDPYKVDGL